MRRLKTRAKVKHLELEFRRHEEALLHCVRRIDEHLLRCRKRIDDYKERFSILIGLNERLANLGEDPVELRSHVDSQSFDDLILSRIEALKSEGKTLSS
jgi:hypothetical protein